MKLKNFSSALCILLVFSTNCNRELTSPTTSKPVAQEENTMEVIRKKIKAGALVVDVRTPMEYQMGHYPGAINIPVDQIAARLKEFGDPQREVVVYCASGARSEAAKRFLEQKGYRVTNAGGLRDMPR